MTRAPAHLQLMKQAEATDEGAASSNPTLTTIEGSGPDDGRLAHPATVHRETPLPTRPRAEGQLIGFVAELVGAPRTARGVVAAGVTEAALLVLRGARDERPALKHATVVLPASAHPAYFAAAATLGLTPLVVPLDGDGRAPLGPMTAAIRDDTVLVVASAPSYTHGTVDPVAWLAAATAAKSVPLHVDATSGGWALAYAERTGRVGPSWGFAMAGVTSMALDVGPESGGAGDLTAVLHRSAASSRATRQATLVRGPLDLTATWDRPSALLADLAETLHEVGHAGCAQLSVDALDATAAVVAGLLDQRGVHLAAKPDSTVVTLRTDTTCDAFTLADALHQRGWAVRPVLPETGPPLLRLPVTAAMLPLVDDLLTALGEAVVEAQTRGRAQIDPTLDRLLATLDPDEVSDYSAHLLLDAAATLDATDPERTGRRAATNLLIAAAGPGVREALLSVHRARLTTPVRSQPANDWIDANE